MNTKEPVTAPSDANNPKGQSRNPGMKSAIDAAIMTFDARNAHPYDGLMGQLPDWMPSPLKHEFNSVRNRLLDSEPIDDVQNWLRLGCSPTAGGWMYVPSEYDRDIDALVYIQSIVTLGPQGGLDAYLGKGGVEVVRGMVRVEHNRKAAQRPRLDGLQRVILNLLRKRPEGAPARPYVERCLREMQHTEVDGVTVEGVDDDEIHWSDARTKAGTTRLSGLKDRVSRALRQLEIEKPD